MTLLTLRSVQFIIVTFILFVYQQKQVVKDVVLTINQAIEPVEKGVTKIQQTFHHKTVVSSDDEEEETDVAIETNVTENLTGKENEFAMV